MAKITITIEDNAADEEQALIHMTTSSPDNLVRPDGTAAEQVAYLLAQLLEQAGTPLAPIGEGN